MDKLGRGRLGKKLSTITTKLVFAILLLLFPFQGSTGRFIHASHSTRLEECTSPSAKPFAHPATHESRQKQHEVSTAELHSEIYPSA